MSDQKQFPEGMVPLGKEPFHFSCHPGVSCFTVCCKKVDLVLFPYDVLRLKNSLGMNSEQFLTEHVTLVKGDNPFFPTVMLKLTDDQEQKCPFLTDQGCSVYDDRPSACRTYPLERAVDRTNTIGRPDEFYFVAKHDYCKGHFEDNQFTVTQWVRNQRIDTYNMMNDLWAEMDTLFRSNPWKGEGSGGPKQQMCFMGCYDIDGFKEYAGSQQLLKRFRLTKDQKKRLVKDDMELLKFSFEFIRLMLTGKSSLVQK